MVASEPAPVNSDSVFSFARPSLSPFALSSSSADTVNSGSLFTIKQPSALDSKNAAPSQTHPEESRTLPLPSLTKDLETPNAFNKTSQTDTKNSNNISQTLESTSASTPGMAFSFSNIQVSKTTGSIGQGIPFSSSPKPKSPATVASDATQQQSLRDSKSSSKSQSPAPATIPSGPEREEMDVGVRSAIAAAVEQFEGELQDHRNDSDHSNEVKMYSNVLLFRV